MKIDLSKVSYDGQWFDFGEARLKIRPYPSSREDIAIKDGAMILSGGSGCDMFNYCLEAWENVTGADDQPLKLSPQVKKQIFDFGLGSAGEEGKEMTMSNFVLTTARKLRDALEDDVKN